MSAYGYVVSVGYMGRLHDGSYLLFDTEGEYLDYFREE